MDKTISITANRKAVLDEVSMTADYTARKMTGEDDGAFDRLSVTEADDQLLCSLFDQGRGALVQSLSGHLESAGMTGDVLTVKVRVSESHDERVNEGMSWDVYEFLVAYVLAKWFELTNKQEADAKAQLAAGLLGRLREKVVKRKGPERPVF